MKDYLHHGIMQINYNVRLLDFLLSVSVIIFINIIKQLEIKLNALKLDANVLTLIIYQFMVLKILNVFVSILINSMM